MNDDQIQAFQELVAGIYIQQLRIYDLLAVLLSERNPDKVAELEALHESGKVLCPDPALKIED
jgi:hypothetical protein